MLLVLFWYKVMVEVSDFNNTKDVLFLKLFCEANIYTYICEISNVEVLNNPNHSRWLY